MSKLLTLRCRWLSSNRWRSTLSRSLALIILLSLPRLVSGQKTDYTHPAAGSVFAPTYSAAQIQLLSDPAFNNGFRAFGTCAEFDGDSSLGLGNCIAYHTPYLTTYYGRTFAIHTWPDTQPAGPQSDVNKYWNFNEGIHEGYSHYGYSFPFVIGSDGQLHYSRSNDLAVHRLEANGGEGTGGLYTVSPNEILLQSMNNVSSQDPNFGHLVRTAWTDRHGLLYTYMDTSNEIRNVATNNGSEFAYDTWPHFHIEQNFKQLIDLATLSQVNLSVNVKMWPANLMPNTIPNSQFSNANWGIEFVLRRKDNPSVVVFLGYTPYSVWSTTDSPPEYQESFGGDQFGQALYRGNPNDIGGPVAADGSVRTISINLGTLLSKAIAKANGGLGIYVLEDYYLSSVAFGWETMGYEAVQSQISAVSLVGEPKMIFDSEVYQDNTYDAYNGDLPWAGGGAAGLRRAHWSKWGVDEGRAASPTFSSQIYLSKYEDVRLAYERFPGDYNYRGAIQHYILYGRNEGRTGHW